MLEQDVLETWMLLEYCDRGSLQRAIERGKLQSRAPGGGPDLVSHCHFSLQTVPLNATASCF